MRMPVRLGTKNFTEQILLGEIMAQAIERRTGLRVERRFNLGGTMICHGAIVSNEIDIYPEYTGTGLTAVLKLPPLTDPEAAYDAVSRAYADRFGLTWLGPFGFNNTYTITVRRSAAATNGWVSISDLIGDAPRLKAGFTSEFAERPDGYPGLRKAYGLSFGEVVDLDPSLMYEAIADAEVDVICAFSTDGRIPAYDLQPLEDDRRFFPPYVAAPVARSDFLAAYPEVGRALAGLAGTIDDAAMQRMNYEADGKGQSPAEVASRFLDSLGKR
jgi:glycine betaine/choline ABC-type transport system substrate-binding protein